jgi:hypothetical protein
MTTLRFEAQDLGIGTIKMVESQLKGDKVLDLEFTTLWETRCLISTFFLQIPLITFSHGFLSSMEGSRIFITPQWWLDGRLNIHFLFWEEQNAYAS